MRSAALAASAPTLSKQFLGQGATQSLFAPGEQPAAFMAVTLHPLETITPAAQTWGLPVIDYSVVPNKDEDDDAKETEINARTQEAARDLMSEHEYDGKIVLVRGSTNTSPTGSSRRTIAGRT
jgi:hypothetical protein